jgi:site-specific DNA recombinase
MVLVRCMIYIRVSTDEQADKGNSLYEQRERLTAYCTAMGWADPEYIIDDGYSAKNLNRPGIKKLITRVENNEFDIILTSKLDRLCRNLLDLLQMVELFSTHNCSFVSASESFDTSTAVGRMTLQLLGTFAEFERERISERVKDNMMSLAKNTDKVLTIPCYGYDIEDGRYIINADEAKYVEIMFEFAEDGHGHRAIAKHLNDHGSLTKRGKMWDQTNVKRLMNTETITGVMIYNKRETKNGKITMREKKDWIIKENNHPAIIPPERFEKVQMIMKSRSFAKKHADNETYLLTGLLKCKHCGGGMKGSTNRHKRMNKEYAYYRYICSAYVSGYGCKHHAVHRDDLEQVIVERIKYIASTPTSAYAKMVIASSASVTEEIADVKSQLARVAKRMQKQIEAFEKELISEEDLKEAGKRVETERKTLNERLLKLESKSGDREAVISKAKSLIKDITGPDRLKSKSSIRQLIERIEVEDGKSISVVWKP